MKRAVLVAALVACNQQEKATPAPSAPPPTPRPEAPAPREVVAPPDAAPAPVAVASPDAAPPKATRDRDRADEVHLEEEAAKYADLLTGEADTGSDSDMRHKPGADLAQQIEDVKESGKNVAVGGGAGRGGNLATLGDGTMHAGSAQDDVRTGRLSVTSKQALDESSLTADQVLAKIQAAYMAGLKRCYRDLLHKDPTARGRVTLALTVDETGRATGAHATAFDDGLEHCVQDRMSGWRFPVPKDVDGEPTDAAFQIGLQLAPD